MPHGQSINPRSLVDGALSTNSLPKIWRLSERLSLIAQRRRRVEKVAQGVSPGSKVKIVPSPRGATQFHSLAGHPCAAPPALVIISTFPSADALAYLLNAPTALSSAIRCILNRPKFLVMQPPPNAGVVEADALASHGQEGGLLDPLHLDAAIHAFSLMHSSPCFAPAPALPLWSAPSRPTERPQQR